MEDRTIASGSTHLVFTENELSSNGDLLKRFGLEHEGLVWKFKDTTGQVYYQGLNDSLDTEQYFWDRYQQYATHMKAVATTVNANLGDSQFTNERLSNNEVRDLVSNINNLEERRRDLENTELTDPTQADVVTSLSDDVAKALASSYGQLLDQFSNPESLETFDFTTMEDAINTSNAPSLRTYATVFMALGFQDRGRVIYKASQDNKKEVAKFFEVVSGRYQQISPDDMRMAEGNLEFLQQDLEVSIVSIMDEVKEEIEVEDTVDELFTEMQGGAGWINRIGLEGTYDSSGDLVDAFDKTEELYMSNMGSVMANQWFQLGLINEAELKAIDTGDKNSASSLLRFMHPDHRDMIFRETYLEFQARHLQGLRAFGEEDQRDELTDMVETQQGREISLQDMLSKTVLQTLKKYRFNRNSDNKIEMIYDPNGNLEGVLSNRNLSDTVNYDLSLTPVQNQYDYSETNPSLLGTNIATILHIVPDDPNAKTKQQKAVFSLYQGISEAMQNDGATIGDAVYTEELSNKWYAHPYIISFVNEWETLGGKMDWTNPILQRLLGAIDNTSMEVVIGWGGKAASRGTAWADNGGYGLMDDSGGYVYKMPRDIRVFDIGEKPPSEPLKPLYQVRPDAPVIIPGALNPDFTWETTPAQAGFNNQYRYSYNPTEAIDDVVTIIGDPSTELEPEEWQDIINAIHTPGITRRDVLLMATNYARGITAADIMASSQTVPSTREGIFGRNLTTLDVIAQNPEISRDPRNTPSHVTPTFANDEERVIYENYFAGTPVGLMVDGTEAPAYQRRLVYRNGQPRIEQSSTPFLRVYNRDNNKSVINHRGTNHATPKSFEELETMAAKPIEFYSAEPAIFIDEAGDPREITARDELTGKHLTGRLNSKERITLILPDRETLNNTNSLDYQLERKYDNQSGIVELHLKPNTDKPLISHVRPNRDYQLRWDAKGNVWLIEPIYFSTYSRSAGYKFPKYGAATHLLPNFTIHEAANSVILNRSNLRKGTN